MDSDSESCSDNESHHSSDSMTALKKIGGQGRSYSDMSSEKKQAIEDADSRSVYVGNVHYDVDEDCLEKLFKSGGPIKRITIPVNKDNHHKGFAYIEFEKVDGQRRALRNDGYLLKGRQLKVHPKRTNVPGMSTTDETSRMTLKGAHVSNNLDNCRSLDKGSKPKIPDRQFNQVAPVAPKRLASQNPCAVRRKIPIRSPSYDLKDRMTVRNEPPIAAQGYGWASQNPAFAVRGELPIRSPNYDLRDRMTVRNVPPIAAQGYGDNTRQMYYQQAHAPHMFMPRQLSQQHPPVPQPRRTQSESRRKRHYHINRDQLSTGLEKMTLKGEASASRPEAHDERRPVSKSTQARRSHKSDVSVAIHVTHSSDKVGQGGRSRSRLGANFDNPF